MQWWTVVPARCRRQASEGPEIREILQAQVRTYADMDTPDELGVSRGLRLGARLAGRAQARDLALEVGQRVEAAVHAGEAQIRDLVQVAQRPEDRQPDVLAGDL